MQKEEKIKIYPLHVGDLLNEAEFEYIENTLEAKQKFVGGWIQGICFNPEHKLDIICNDDGKLQGLMPNRAWVIDGKVADIIVGEAFICRHSGDEYCSIQEEDKELILNTFRPIFLMTKEQCAVVNSKGKIEFLKYYE